MRTVSWRLVVLAAAIAPSVLLADIVPTGFVSWSVNVPGNTGEFTITNLTGPNGSAFPDTSFPVATPLSYTGLSLQVDFSDGSSQMLGSSYFTLGSDGLSFTGGIIPIGGANPFPTDAVLTGSFSPTDITLNDGSVVSILDSFSAEILPS